MKGETILAIILAAVVAIIITLVAFVWFPEKSGTTAATAAIAFYRAADNPRHYPCMHSVV